ncbi:DNA replication and repair protein RecF [bacterium]|nr:DNA replication and repair protein RecF [bacterium]
MRLILHNFRLYKKREFLIKKFPLFIVGPNGSGKTTILEALYFLSTTKSFRTNKKRDLIKNSQKEAYLSLEEEGRLEAVLRQKGSNLYQVNRKKVKRSHFISRFFVSLFWWGDFKTVYGSPIERRKMLNLFCLQIEPRYLFWLAEYKKVIKARNLALAKEDRTLIEVWSEKMIPLAVKIWQTRKKVLDLLNKNISSVLSFLYPDTDSAYISYQGFLLDSKRLEKDISKNLKREIKIQRTLLGPHRDDLRFYWAQKLLENYSQGEIKIFLLALKLGFLKALKGKKFFLIDDAFSGLDSFCQKRLISLSEQIKIPLILTHQKKVNKFPQQVIELK